MARRRFSYPLSLAVVVAALIDVVAVKGRKQGVPIYELLALKADNDAASEALAETSTRALDAYLARRFTEAATLWNEIIADRPDDQAATVMRDRAVAFAAEPPPSEWTGVWVATSK